MLILWLPFPISVNRLFPGTKRRHKSKEYEKWTLEAGQLLMMQKKERFTKPVRISYRFGQPDKRRRDLDNLFKCCNDLLVAHSIIEDDSLIHRIAGEWADISGTEATLELI